MNKSMILFGFVTFLMLLSCNSYKSKAITKENIITFWNNFELDSKLSSNERDFLKNLNSIAKGREDYKYQLLETLDNFTADELEVLLVNEQDFNFISNKIFKLLSSNEVTYIDLLDDISSMESINAVFSKKLQDVYLEIDSICIEKDRLYQLNPRYITPDKLYGYCPFLADDHPLYLEADSIRNVRDREIKLKFPILTRLAVLNADFLKSF